MASAYTDWVRGNPSAARSLEQMVRTVVMFSTNPNSLLQFEAGFSAANVLSFFHTELIGPEDGVDVTTGGDGTASPLPPRPTDETNAELVARRAHHVLCEVQCVLELLGRNFLATVRSANRLVVLVEVIKSVLIVLSRWTRVKTTFARVSRSLTSPSSPTTHTPRGSPASPPSRGSRRLVVPVVLAPDVDPATGAALPPRMTGWRDWLHLVLDVVHLVRPAIFAYYSLLPRRRVVKSRGGAASGLSAVANMAAVSNRRAAWRVWVISFLLEMLMAILTYVADRGAPVIVASPAAASSPTDEPSPVAPAADRLPGRIRALTSYLFREPFFGLFLRRAIERWVVRGWIARNVPLLGTIIAAQTKYALRMQRESFLYTAGGANAPAASAFAPIA